MPDAFNAHLLPEDTLHHKAALLVGAACPVIELEDAEVDLVEVQVVERVSEGQPKRLASIAPVPVSGTDPD